MYTNVDHNHAAASGLHGTRSDQRTTIAETLSLGSKIHAGSVYIMRATQSIGTVPTDTVMVIIDSLILTKF